MLLAAIAHAALFALAQEPLALWPTAFVSVAPLVWVPLGAAKPRRAIGVVWIVAFLMWLWLERWLIGVTAVGWPMLAAYLALYPAAFVWLGGRIAQRAPGSRWGVAVALAAVWTGLEMLRGEVVLTGYSWFLLAHPLIGTPIAQLAEWGGVYGVTFILALTQTIIVVALTRRCVPIALAARLSVAAAIVAAAFVAGATLLAAERARAAAAQSFIHIAVVQTNVPQSNKTGWTVADRVRDFARMQELTVEAAGRGRTGETPVPLGEGNTGGTPVPLGEGNTGGTPVPLREGNTGGTPVPLGEGNTGGTPVPLGEGNTGETPVPLGEGNTGETPVPLDLIVWPETMFPGETLSPEAVAEMRDAGLVYEDGTPTWAFNDALAELQRALGTPLLVGAIGYDGLRIGSDGRGITFEHDGKYNSAFIIKNGFVSGARYDKLHLTPFGEVMPGISWSDRLERMLLSVGAPGMAFDLDSGSARTVFEVGGAAAGDAESYDEDGSVEERTGETPVPLDPGWHVSPSRENTGETPVPLGTPVPLRGVRVVTPICFEAATARVCRRLVYERGERRADVMVNLTNDGWFGDTPGKREQHLLVSRWRAIELRTPMVRAANTGISAAFDTTGRIQEIGPENRSERMNIDGVMRASVALPRQRSTIYARFGDWAGWAALIAAGLIAGWTWTPAGRREPKGNAG